MAVTKIHPVKATLGRAVRYVINPDKTDEYTLVDCFSCSPLTAEFDFKSAISQAMTVEKPNLAFHLIQSFKPGETTPETAHEIGLELIDKLFADKYSVVIGTHVDKHHIHNHILFCAVDNIDHKKYISTRSSYMKIRQTSDRLCEEHGLSVIKEDKDISMSYKEWLENGRNNSWKAELRSDINECIRSSVSYDEFIMKMREKGYRIKGESPDGSKGKYLSFLSPKSERWIRGRETSFGKGLGRNYTREAIMNRIEDRAQVKTEMMKINAFRSSKTDLVEPTDRNMKWVGRENLKRMSEAFSQLKRMGFVSKNQVLERISYLEQQAEDLRQETAENKEEMKAFAKTIKYVTDYRKYKPVHERYEKSTNRERYLQEHLSQITLFEEAKEVLESSGIDPVKLDLDAFKAEYYRMKSTNEANSEKEKTCLSEAGKLKTLLSDLDRFTAQKNKDRSI